MNYIKSFFSIVLLASMVTAGCNKKLEVEPQQNITPDQIKTEGDVLAVLYGTYSLLQGSNAFGERYMLAADLLAAENHTAWKGTFRDYLDLYNKAQINTNLIAQGIWTTSYSTINTLNTVLSKTDLVNQDDRAAVIGEAKFLRGLVYFELVNYFGKPHSAGSTTTNLGVPLMLEPVFSYDEQRDKKPRAKVEEVYTQIIADLTAAAASLPEETSDGRVTKWAAHAILSRVYLNQAKYDLAATAANEVIGYYGDLPGTFDNAFNNEGTPGGEDIFAIMQTSQSNAGTSNNGLTTFYLPKTSNDPTIAGGGRGDMQASPAYINIFEAGDDRRAFTYTGVSITGSSGRYSKKWAVFYRNIPVVRLGEMYLTRGEANYRKGGAPIGDNTPLEDINAVRTRSNATPLVAIVDGSEFVSERFRELAFEGDRLWTLKRLKLNIDGKPYDHNLLVLPIPLREREVNQNLEQNGGYQ